MHLRRAILLFALVLGLTALAAAVSPTHETATPTLTTPAPAPSSSAGDSASRTVSIDARPDARAVERKARAGDRLQVLVSSAESGQIVIPRLGRTESVSAATPARFDLLAPPPGKYDVMFSAVDGGEPRRVGTLITRP